MSVSGRTSGGVLAVPDEAAKPWTRSLPFAELTQFLVPNEYAELALIGRWSESVQINVVPASSDFSVALSRLTAPGCRRMTVLPGGVP
jgi:hypothetical protein